ncbi:heparinase II/III family protein [Pannonibacter indicus]|uniref:heparinase II/III domain-containing protein n=1 Tax=Pannonibacter indicus TaxID=466044 RepID=UPI0035AFC01F
MFVERLKDLPDSLGDFVPDRVTGEADGWAGVPQRDRMRLLEAGEAALARPWPVLLASGYRQYCTAGDRAAFEALYFDRRLKLNDLVLAEKVEGQGRFLDAIIDGIFLICEESGWQLPAHNAYERGGTRLPLPDPFDPVVDLFAAETAATLVTAHHLLSEPLGKVSPAVGRRVHAEVERRILTPYLNRHFWWMGRGGERMNNWTAWITQNVLLATFALPTSQEQRRAVLDKALPGLDAFLKDYAPDGACEEGVVYYRHAALCLCGAMTVLDQVAPGLMAPLWREPKIRNMADYILHMYVAGDYYVNFADSAARVDPCGAREYLFGRAVGSQALSNFAAAGFKRPPARLMPGEWNLWYRLQAVLLAREIDEVEPEPEPAGKSDMFYPGIGLFIARDDRFVLAVKAGNNGESHNHNDVGSVTLYKNGVPLLIDAGVETYTAKTFSPRRYEIWTMQSAYHNLPSFAGVAQSCGAGFAARDVAVSFAAGEAHISMDIAGAYPPEAGLNAYRRLVTLRRGACVEIQDEHDGEKAATLSLMLMVKPQLIPQGLRLEGLADIHLCGGGTPVIEPIVIADPRLRQSWPELLYRVLVPLAGPVLTLRIF